ncbi:hypothetical protein KCMC57_up15920 [Kitasatospora sp. CMC57]|uniref:Uncharacterized protein n=1 Tax=Kitasatospora sp. CMC57 TaxID=3231513 RepID=A0AB33JUU6_9ACTN
MNDAEPAVPTSRDQALLLEQASLYGWRAQWQLPEHERATERLLLTLRDTSLTAVFSHDGSLSFARLTELGTATTELDLSGALAVLRDHAGAPPEDTPPGESSTTAGISVPEPPELSRAWGSWPLAVVGLLVLSVVLFMIARIAGW